MSQNNVSSLESLLKPQIASYGMKVRYLKDQPISFPDFTLTFLRKRHIQHAVFKPGFVDYDFRINNNKDQKIISWSAGTGDIAPKPFEIGGKQFLLELQRSELFPDQLKEDELVIRMK